MVLASPGLCCITLWRGRLLTTGYPPFLRPVVVGGGRVVWGCGGGAGGGGGGARPAACRVARRGGPALALAPFPVPGRSSLCTASCCWGGWLVLVWGGDACRAIGGGLQSGAALIDVRLDVGPLPPVLPRRLWRVVGWVGFLSDVIGGVESTLWEGCYPSLTLAHGICVIVCV